MDLNDELKSLSEQVARARRLTASIQAMEKQMETLIARRAELSESYNREKGDVERLEGKGLSRLWFSLTGKLEERLDKEQYQAMVAGVRLETVEKEIASLTASIEEARREAESLSGCEQRYATRIAQREALLRAADPAKAARFDALDEADLNLDTLLAEIDEAERAGQAVLSQIGVIRDSLNRAESWGTWDLFGGGIISHMEKHSHLDEAQQGINRLQATLDRFHAELADVQISREMTAEVDGFLRFADWFFDGLIADWAVLSHIEDSQRQVSRVEEDVQKVLVRLKRMRGEGEVKRAALGRERFALIREGLEINGYESEQGRQISERLPPSGGL